MIKAGYCLLFRYNDGDILPTQLMYKGKISLILSVTGMYITYSSINWCKEDTMQENFDEVISPYIKKTGVKEAVSHWSGKSFYIPWTIFNVWKATAIYIGV